MKTRYSYGGDEHIFVEVSEEMSLEDRKARRKEINRLAARRAHQKKLDSIQQLESVRNLSFKHLGAWNHSQGSLCPVDYRRITLF